MTDLTQALEERFGPASDWSLKIQAASAQLATMQQLMGDDFATYIRSARQAADEHQSRASYRRTLDRRERLGQLLTPTGNHLTRADTLDVAWAINYGLEILLKDEEYEHLIDAVAGAMPPAAVNAGACP
ncbi:hypothetical protein [Streptomyces flavochromogenes]|uniref:hypothetical protein n=1 Tax=Streptomyces flavochromogenes TaxID=68199 RepID=UPI0004C151BD|nr:hypothetical protein [Streptomyces flavochromogenes]